MRLRELVLAEKAASKIGLTPVVIPNLPSVLAFIGKNGSGKTRILNQLQAELLAIESPFEAIRIFSDVPDNVQGLVKNLDQEQSAFLDLSIRKSKDRLDRSEEKEFALRQQTRMRARMMPQNKALFEQQEKDLPRLTKLTQTAIANHVLRIKDEDIRALLGTIKNRPQGTDGRTFEQLLTQVSEGIQGSIIKSIQESARTYLSELPHQLAKEFLNALGEERIYTTTKPFTQFRLLQSMIGRFMHKTLEWQKREVKSELSPEGGLVTRSLGYWILGGVEFNYDSLSDGEKILLVYGLMFFMLDLNPAVRLRDCIVLIDEPELHLHPEAELAIIQALQGILSKTGQLIIATHSLPIISSLELRSLFLVTEGRIQSPGRATPAQAVVDLMGLEAHANRMADFLGALDRWAYVSFVEQCLLEPEVIGSTSPGDPQLQLLREALMQSPGGTTLLDFGAGKGRLIAELSMTDSRWRIEALEPARTFHDVLVQKGVAKVYQDVRELPESEYSFVILCGVLHEIPVGQWTSVLKSIHRSLKDDGWLLLIEDSVLPRGERIADHGFLVLDYPAMVRMFNSDGVVQLQHRDARYRERIVCACVPKQAIEKVEDDSIRGALTERKFRLRRELQTLRESKPEVAEAPAVGRKLGFYSELYVNLDLAIEQIGGPSA